MQTLVLVFHILAALGIGVLVLLQHGKGADMGAAFGSGSAGRLFGSPGASMFRSPTTAVLTAPFFASSRRGPNFFAATDPSGGCPHSEAPLGGAGRRRRLATAGSSGPARAASRPSRTRA